MTYLNKAAICLYVLLLTGATAAVYSQAPSTGNWQLGLGIGSTNYYGDLSNYRINGLKNIGKLLDYNKYYIDQPSFSILFQKKLTPTLGFMIQANTLQFAMSDRYRKKNGSIDTTSMNYSRSLNFRTTLQDAGIAFTFSPNNGRIAPENTFFYPSFFVGVGVSKFTVKGDLYDENNNPYNYRLPGNIMDGTFETNLRDQRTETDSKYRNVEPYVDLGLALNFRINQSISIALQSDIKYSASDYLDDVSKRYKTSYATPAEAYAAKPGYNVVDPTTLKRGDDNGMNDFYINNRIVLNIGLKKKTPVKKFNAPVIYTLNVPFTQQKKGEDDQRKKIQAAQDSLIRVKTDSLLKIKRDSLFADSLAFKRSSQNQVDSNVQKQLSSISSQLQDIKMFLRDQQVTPRIQQLQYQSDSLRALRNRIMQQRSVSREDNLKLRIYDLQLDSLNNQMEKLQWNGQYPARSNDSALRYYGYPELHNQASYERTQRQEMQLEGRNEQPIVKDTVYEADLKTWDDEVKSLRKDKRYKSDAAYKKTVDSLQNKLNGSEKRLRSAKTVESENAALRDQPQRSTEDAQLLRNANQRKIDSLQQRLDALEQTSADSAASLKANNNRLRDTMVGNSLQEEDALSESRKLQQMKADSILLLRRQLQRTSDSAAYYRQHGTGNEIIVPDTVQQKKKWYRNIFGSGKKKKKVATVNDVNNQQAYAQKEQLYNRQLEGARNRIGQLEKDSAAQAGVTTHNQSVSEQQINSLKTQLQLNSDSVDMFRREIQRSNDSSAYYKQAIATPVEVTRNDKASKRWYKDMFTSEKKMKKKRAAKESKQNRYVEQQQYYDDDVVRMQRRIDDLENRNKEISSDYDRLNSARNRRDRVSDVSTPVVIYDNDRRDRNTSGNISEINALRDEISRLRYQANENNQRTYQADLIPGAAVSVPTQAVMDTSQISSLKSELSAIRSQLDSLKNYRPPVAAEKTEPKQNNFDASGFPVISVYFKLGAVSLPQDQLNRILPFGQVASKNTNTSVTLRGFTDPVGNPAANATIARKRTEFVKNFIMSRFKIAESRITVEDPSVSEVEKNKKPNPLDRRVDMNLSN